MHACKHPSIHPSIHPIQKPLPALPKLPYSISFNNNAKDEDSSSIEIRGGQYTTKNVVFSSGLDASVGAGFYDARLGYSQWKKNKKKKRPRRICFIICMVVFILVVGVVALVLYGDELWNNWGGRN
jgi:hypothetical protein